MGVFGKSSQDALEASSGGIGSSSYTPVLDVSGGSGTLTKAILYDVVRTDLVGGYIKVTVDGGIARVHTLSDGDVFTADPDKGTPYNVGTVIFNTKFSSSLKVEMRAAYNSSHDGKVYYSLDN